MPVPSAGLLLFKRMPAGIAVLLVHPGGPYWQRRDLGAWSIPKGERLSGESAEATARRELAEETGVTATAPLWPLGRIRQKGGKEVEAFAAEQDFDPRTLTSNCFEIEWPPGSSRRRSFAEVDRAEWFPLDVARRKINPAQCALIDRLEALVRGD